ncbi:bifunctional 4-hydroxy-2-oxoglutarate aldolase/2-dehydro-3-deoxy-phosphogluconate aldolase [Colwellia sp. M166]|jgi:2-dehydro-3-deoxyphosphogluconate aldolase/(4S)-4-hydroxy-2-oxoglutarate aldolase|uniref:bifunctional 4-hydroxy-2-oxoglutarate aldolase/2-dehydro-3-deoxy-phosphogluconate aldolase n=1 Tax=Colwellia sp. M166 TaxID=2583805 RepID=UPI00211E9A8C|nr:bifunctional 4-hydroxy-2-oxoglutarate aldolase/2-dehydro-3-deoxy-phosphogluconate aldolase [Colwellia sp. M166]UUO22598.1 bifunctional 4-hydroxy-2-oxoglutarate aldolase/2-dehydro-3-deoxy-phosphogluconate aldolase [Colwellia sp. M166]|tara:strand:+ start:1382 stop:2005 length:624 start_codon:yes stop_codon:yes gene_type:complete
MTSFSTLMGKQTLLPIIQASSVSQGLAIGEAMAAAGIHLVEVVLRTEASFDIIKALKQELPALKVGAGTVIDADILKQALDVGSDFIITPTISNNLLSHLSGCTVPVLPGVSTASDILLAKEYGYRELKLFPASLSGGVPFLKAMAAVFNNIIFCPTGGINESNQQAYLALKNVFAVGGTWIASPDWVANQEWTKITQACKAAQTTL